MALRFHISLAKEIVLLCKVHNYRYIKGRNAGGGNLEQLNALNEAVDCNIIASGGGVILMI